jgi:hypothetical protein
MKKIHFPAVLILIASLIAFSCSKEAENNDPPTMAFKTGIHASTGMHYVNTDTTVTVNDDFIIGIKANSNSEKNLKKLTIVRTFETSPIKWDTTFSNLTFNFSKIFKASGQVGNEDWTFTLSDVNDNTSSLSLRVITVEMLSDIDYFEGIDFGPYGVNNPNFFAVDSGMVYSMTEIDTNSTYIDWVFFDSNSLQISIMSPDDDGVLLPYPTIGSDWNHRSATRFKETIVSSDDFDAINTSSQIFIIANGANLSRLVEAEITGGMHVGNVFAFITESGKMGLMRIAALDNQVNPGLSTMTLDIKIQQ